MAFVVANDPRIPDEVSYRARYVNPAPRPAAFRSARLWGIAIADARVPGHEWAQVEVAWTRLSCQVDGREVVLNDDGGQVRGGLYMRQPWFGTDAHDLMPLAFDLIDHAVVLRVGQRFLRSGRKHRSPTLAARNFSEPIEDGRDAHPPSRSPC